jgi:hypothetical protein
MMDYITSLKFQGQVLHIAAIVAGVISVGGALRQIQTGRTYYRGEITAESQPVYFAVIMLIRLMIGIAALLSGLLLPWP